MLHAPDGGRSDTFLGRSGLGLALGWPWRFPGFLWLWGVEEGRGPRAWVRVRCRAQCGRRVLCAGTPTCVPVTSPNHTSAVPQTSWRRPWQWNCPHVASHPRASQLWPLNPDGAGRSVCRSSGLGLRVCVSKAASCRRTHSGCMWVASPLPGLARPSVLRPPSPQPPLQPERARWDDGC